MATTDRRALIAFPLLVLAGCLVALAGSQGGSSMGGVPLFALSVGLAYLIQWLAFIPAYVFQTERFFDLTGSLTYVLVMSLSVVFSPNADTRSVLLAALVLIWAVRLGSFLFRRITQAGKDDRFDTLKPSFIRFLNVWTMQGLWVTFTAAAALVAITSSAKKAVDGYAIVGALIWLFGFAIEVVADDQKRHFNADITNRGRFIQSGLWARSRHPNYFGEIVLWFGVAVMAMPVLHGWQWVALLSPIFVTLLLTRVSGIPLLEQKADAKWGGQDAYEAYKRHTPVLVPKLTTRRS